MLRSFDQGWASHRSELRKGELLDKDHSTIHATNADDSESRDVKPRSEFEEHFKLDRSQCEKAKEIWIHLYDRRYKVSWTSA